MPASKYKKKSTTKKKKSSKPKPSDLGSGQAYRAGKALKKRKSRIDAALSKATGGKKKKKTRKK